MENRPAGKKDKRRTSQGASQKTCTQKRGSHIKDIEIYVFLRQGSKHIVKETRYTGTQFERRKCDRRFI